MVRINLNEFVKFVPTGNGLQIMKTNPDVAGLRPDYSGEYRMVLWQFCACFGPHFRNGSSFIKSNTLVIGDQNEHV